MLLLRSDTVVYMFGYYDWGLGISCGMGHSSWSEVAQQPHVSLWETPAGPVAASCGDRCNVSVSRVLLQSRRVLVTI